MVNSSQFFGIFCDDIRREYNGKATLVGCYTDTMYVPTFPFQPKGLCVHFSFCCDPKDTPESFSIVLYQDGNEKLRLQAETATAEDQTTKFRLDGGFEIPELSFSEESLLELKFEANSIIYEGPSLNVKLMPNE